MKNQEGKIRPLGSIDLDEIERPLKVVEECMQRLKMKHEENMKGQSVDGYDDENFVIEDCQKDSRSESRNSHDSENSNDSRIEVKKLSLSL